MYVARNLVAVGMVGAEGEVVAPNRHLEASGMATGNGNNYLSIIAVNLFKELLLLSSLLLILFNFRLCKLLVTKLGLRLIRK